MIIAKETGKRQFLIYYRKNIIKTKSRRVSSLKDSRQEKKSQPQKCAFEKGSESYRTEHF